ncbi:MAG: hypothetical protein ACI8P0_002042 [Planctomycetaceae bacterium]|jgi:hypothetical protein
MAGLNPESARIFRITHIKNVPWILDHGLHCQSSETKDPNFIGIGMTELISRRQTRQVPVSTGGVLSDYVPFYFTPFSIMMYNIKTGYNDVTQRSSEEIVILVSSLHRLAELEVPFAFTNGHAYPPVTEYFESIDDLDAIDWKILQARDFSRDLEDPGKTNRYQAEALAFREVPINALLGIGCYNANARKRLNQEVEKRELQVSVKTLPNWYF